LKRVLTLWTFAFVLTAAFMVYQKVTGPTYEIRFNTDIAGVPLVGTLLRTHSVTGDLPVVVDVPDDEVEGTIVWRRYPTNEPWQRLHMERVDGQLRATLPRQKMAGQLEYRVEFTKDTAKVAIPNDEAAVARFKGDVPNTLFVFHVSFMILGLLFSTGCGFEAFSNGTSLKVLARFAFAFLLLGGLVLGPFMQKYAFDVYWTGWPFGGAWTDNKMAIGVLAWLVAVWRTKASTAKQPTGKWWCALAMIIVFVIYAIPHSVNGSIMDYKTGEQIQAMAGSLLRWIG
jgi:hypothetical protein